jgi:hypothetical protein
VLALWFALAVGATLRLWAYASRDVFWIDEAALASNIVDRPWAVVARPFIYQQLAPYFYVLLAKLATVLFGVTEYSLRLPALLAGLAFLPALALLTKRLFALPAAFCAVAFATGARLLVHYATELKPYSGDALVATVLLITAWHVFAQSGARGWRALLPLTAAGVLAPWFSLPAVFVLAALGVGLLVDGVARSREHGLRDAPRYWLAVAAVGFLWLLSFFAHYALVLRLRPSEVASLQLYWAGRDGFAPLRGLSALRWFAAKSCYLFTLFVVPAGFGLRYFAALLWLVGIVVVWRKSKAMAIALVGPLPVFFAATALHAYVMTDRLALFAAPLIIVPCAGGVAALVSAGSVVSQLAAAWLVAGMSVLSAVPLLMQLLHPPPASGIRSALTYLQQRVRPSDALYVEELSYWVSAYYARRAHLVVPCLAGESTDHVFARTSNPLRALRGYHRVWALLHVDMARTPHVRMPFEQQEHLLKERLSALGTQISMFDAGDVHVYLYDLLKPAGSERAALPAL